MDDNRQSKGTYEQTSPFYRPLWRRIAITAVVALWLAFEIYNESGLWIAIAAAMLCDRLLDQHPQTADQRPLLLRLAPAGDSDSPLCLKVGSGKVASRSARQ